ncbi:DUF7562 family protein [Halobellus salinisoli]|uniref:DUF7562 family protein n=1 Tax=Halobellus salinisoli TaxID=3108500 RepID=UPI00300B8DB7
MWRPRDDRDGTTVVCIACGASLPRSDTREYDKHGNRWERHGKSFEHLCKECYRELCHQPRGELEALLIDVEDELRPGPSVDRQTVSEADAEAHGDADSDTDSEGVSTSQAAFLSTYLEVVEARYGSIEESERDSE